MSKHQTRRVMTYRDFSHNEPAIFVEKEKMSRLAKRLRKHAGQKHAECLLQIANIFCGASGTFANIGNRASTTSLCGIA